MGNYGAVVTIDNFEIDKIRYIPRTNVLSGDMYEKNSKGQFVTDPDTGNRKSLPRVLKEIPAKWLAFSSKAQKKLMLLMSICRVIILKDF